MKLLIPQWLIIARSVDGDQSSWMQLLVLVILAAAGGVYYLVKNRPTGYQAQGGDWSRQGRAGGKGGTSSKLLKDLKGRWRDISDTVQSNLSTKQSLFNFGDGSPHAEAIPDETLQESKRNLATGMETLELEFLLGVVEDIDSSDKRDVVMRKLNFNELIRRSRVDAVGSNVLKIYAKDEDKLYDRHIQCEAMKQLSARTVATSQ